MEPQETILSDMHVRATSGTTSYTWLDPACVAGDDVFAAALEERIQADIVAGMPAIGDVDQRFALAHAPARFIP